ncbi:hypothetical protein [Protofrankia symbiont of Coriaria ruscifolia]|uniref:Uncharacterized protein n=1 Tax=Candidatus Protofrankia californiensis TaxID=1839754 RepID=A0A1C3NUK7_9ACTN|nr:hypothetical protein [Protofrankia symbiont of Coriaria ruscifolia]SBW18967.1 hypothetical protein FDG2_0903 [Candidatus Protofrankia californiensis]
MRYYTMTELKASGPLDGLDAYTDLLADALYSLHNVTDPDLGATLSTGRIDVTMIVDADTLEEALHKSLTATRTAIHVAGGATPDWERMIREVGTQARELTDA